MGITSIQWTDRSINPIRARNRETGAVGHYCEKPSHGCKNCYADAWNRRVRPSYGHLIGTGLAYDVRNRDKVEIFLDESKLLEVLRRRKPTKWFWCDMTDLFGEWVPDEFIDKCFAVMALTPQHTHQVLTKRADRMREYCSRRPNGGESQFVSIKGYGSTAVLWQRPDLQPWPLPNVWLGVSVEDQQHADERIPQLLDTPAAVRFISAEPLLEDVSLWAFLDTPKRNECLGILGGHKGVPGIDWVIVGGESGPGARPFNLAWARSLVQQCQSASVPVFVKQLGAKPLDTDDFHDGSEACCAMTLRDKKGGDIEEWSEDLRVRQFPEARA